MIDELLQLSRAGERATAGERLDLRDLATRAAGRWEATAAEREQRLTALADGDGAAWMSREDADRILDALVENALAYSPAGTEVEVATMPGGFAVRDRGPGLAPGEEESVFERFHRGGAGRAARPGPASGCRSRASWRAAGAATWRCARATAAAPSPRSCCRPHEALPSLDLRFATLIPCRSAASSSGRSSRSPACSSRSA